VGDGLHDLQLDQLLGQQAQGPAHLACRGLATGEGDQPRFLLAVQFPQVHAPWCPPVQGGLQPRLDELLPDARDRRLADLHRVGNRRIDPARATRAFVRFEEDPRMSQLARRGGARGEQLLELVTFGFGQENHVFLVHADQDTGGLGIGSNHA
jgi:hypothetical protein